MSNSNSSSGAGGSAIPAPPTQLLSRGISILGEIDPDMFVVPREDDDDDDDGVVVVAAAAATTTTQESFFEDSDLYSWLLMNGDLFPHRTTAAVGPMDSGTGGATTSTTTTIPEEEMNTEPEPSPREREDDNDESDSDLSDSEGEEEEDEEDRNGTSTMSGNARTRATSTTTTTTTRGDGKIKKRRTSASSGGGGGPPTTADRLEKNREIARNSRKRKRQKNETLKEEVKRLRDWNRQLEVKLNRSGDTNESKEEIRKREVAEIAQMIKEKRTSDEIRKKLAEYKEVYSDFGRDRKAAIQYHLKELQALLLPNQVSKMTLWSLQQDDSFYDEKMNESTFGGGIWNLLCQECRLTKEQKKQLVAMRDEVRLQRDNVTECLRILKELETRINQNISSMAQQMHKIMKITTPMQQAQFLLWIENNQASVHVLNFVWNKRHMQDVVREE